MKHPKKIIARSLTAVLMLASLVVLPAPLRLSPAAWAAPDDLTITDYTVNDKRIEKGDRVGITLKLRDPKTLTTEELRTAAGAPVASTRVSAFTGATVKSVTTTSAVGKPLEFTVVFQNATYSGEGKDFAFQISYNGDYENMNLSLTECSEYVEPEPEEEEEPEPLDKPNVQIGRDNLPSDLKPGQEFIVNVWVKNLGEADIEGGMLTVSPSSGLLVLDASPSYELGALRDGKTKSIPVRLSVLDKADREDQSIDLSLRFQYDDEVSDKPVSATAEQNLRIPITIPAEKDVEPILQIGRHDQKKPIAQGETQTVSIWVHNLSDIDLASTLATVSPSSELMIADNSATYLLGKVPAGSIMVFDVQVKAPDAIKQVAQSLDVSLKYNYEKGKSTAQGKTEETLPLTAVVTPEEEESEEQKPIAAAVPNVIVKNYTYGSDKVTAGTTFDLTLEFQNTSSAKAIENIVMTLETGKELAITSSANSFHFARLGAGATQSQTINLQAMPDAPSAPAAIQVQFTYEYIDDQQREKVSVDQTISLPIYQLDRFELSADSPSLQGWQFEETYLSLQYINKGKSTVYNVSAELVGEIGTASRIQNVGNIEAGKSGTIDFILTPEIAGENTCTVVVTYEDESMQVLQKEFPFQIFVNEMYYPEPMPEDEMMMEPEEPGPNWKWIGGLGGAAVLAVLVVLFLRRRKKKKANEVDEFQFDEDLVWLDEDEDKPAEKPQKKEDTDAVG